MQTIRHINPLGYVDMPYLRDENGNPRQGPAFDVDGNPTEAGFGCLVPGELLEVDDTVAEVLLAQVINFELVSLDGYTVDQLEEYAASRDIDLGDAKRKGDIVKAIAAEQTARWEARQQPAVEEDDVEGDVELVDPNEDVADVDANQEG